MLEILYRNNGRLNLHYDSDPKEIQSVCSMSKKAFKRALSLLLMENKILLKQKIGIEIKKQ